MATEQGPVFGVAFDADEADARAESERIAKIFEGAFERAFERVGPKMARELSKAFNAGGTKRTFSEGAKAADSLAESMRRAGQSAENMQADIDALNKRVEATKRQLTSLGADSDLFAVIDRELALTQARMRQFSENIEQIADDPDLLRGYQVAFDNAQKTIFREVAGIQSQLRNLTTAQRLEGNRANEVLSRQLQERLQERKLNAAREVVAAQGANAQLLSETRIAGQRQLQFERARSQQRIEIFRATIGQIRALERGLGTVFKASAAVISGAFARVEGTIFRIGSILRRSNRDLNDGLAPALLARERALGRSFDRQTANVQSSLAQQSRILNRFEAQASTGVAGVLTGRSAFAGVLGGGLALGAGAGFVASIRNAIDVGGDFVQGLAVLQAQLKLTDEQMEGVRQQSIDLGNDITLPGVSALDAAEAIQILSKQFGSLGSLALPNAQKAAKGVLQLSRAAGVGAEEAARVVGAAVNVFGVAADEATVVADQVASTMAKAAGVAFNDYADAFTQAAAVTNLYIGPAQDAASALAETNAAIAVLAKGGLVGSDAGTSLKQFFLQANRGTADSNEILGEIIARAGEAGSVFFDASGGARTLSESLDILRRGTEGLSNQEFNRTLTKLFGSDAARAGAILIREDAAAFEELTESLKEQGVAARIAEAQNTGFRGALDALRSVIETQQIKTYEKLQDELAAVTIAFATLLNNIFEAGGAFAVLRSALKGASAALGALLAAKAAAEAVSFLTIALRAVLTPLGAFVTALTLLGAAVGILRDFSPEFNEAFGRLVEAVKGSLADVAERAAGLLADLGDVIAREVIPRLETFAIFLISRVEPAVRRAFGFIRDEVVPAVEALGRFIGFLLLPPLSALADLLFGRVIPALDDGVDSIIGFVTAAQPYVQPAIDGFNQLADAIEKAFQTGDLSGITDGFKALATGLGTTFANIGGKIIDVLEPQLDRVVEFIKGVFTIDRLQDIGLAFLDVVELIGRILGTIVSDPRFVLALEAIVAAAVITGARFIKGVAEGIASNLPELADLLGGQLQTVLREAVEFAFSKAFDPKFVATLIVGAVIATALVQALRRPLEDGATRLGDGFATNFGRRVREVFRNNEFASGFFGGLDGMERAAQRAGERGLRVMQREQERAASILRNLGQGDRGIAGSFVGADGIVRNIDRARFALDELIDKFGASAVAGAGLRGAVSGILDGLRTVRTGVGEVIDGIRFDFQDRGGQTIAAGMGQIRQAFVGGINTIRENLKATGLGLGQAIGGALVSGVGAAMAGRALGGAEGGFETTIGLAGIISSALFAGASVGGGPQGAAVATIVTGIGLITAAWQRNKTAAEEAAARVQTYVDVLGRFNNVADALPDIADQVTAAFAGQSEEVRDVVLRAGLSADELAAIFANGASGVNDAATLIGQGLQVAQDDLQRFVGFLDANSSKADILSFLSNTTEGRNISERLDTLGISASAFADSILAINQQASALEGALGVDAFQRAFNPKPVQETAEAVTDVKNALSFGLGPTPIFDLFPPPEKIAERVDPLLDDIGQINTAIDTLNQQRTEQIQTQINDITTQLDAARDAADLAAESLTSYLTGDYADTLQQAVDQVVVGLPSVASSIADALETGGAIGEAGLRGALEGLDSEIASIIQAGFAEGTITSLADVDAALQPLRDGINQLASKPLEEGGISRAVADELLARIDGALDNETFEGNLKLAADAEAEVSRLQEELNKLNVELRADVVFSPAQINAALRSLFPDANIPLIPGQNEVVDSQSLFRAQSAAVAATAPAAGPNVPSNVQSQPAQQIINNWAISGATEPLPLASEIVRAQTAKASGATTVVRPSPTPGSNGLIRKLASL